MEVILLEKIENLGALGDRVNVKPGYARNYLLPKRKAVSATPERIKEFEARREELEKLAEQTLTQAQERKQKLDGVTVTLSAKSAGEGRLYGSIGPVDIADALSDLGYEVERREVRLPGGPIRMAGEHEAVIHLHTDVNATIKVTVVGEE